LQTFLGFLALFWLTKMVSSFWFTVVALTSIFVAPLVSSEQGRRAAHDTSVRAQELANVAAEKGRELGHDGKVKAAELSSKGKQTIANLSAQAKDTASDMSGKASELSSKGKQTAADLSAQTRGTASDISGTATENIKKLPQIGKNAVNETDDIASSTYGNAKGYISNSPAPPSNLTAGRSDGNRSVTSGASNEAPHLSNSASETTKRTAPGVNTGKQPDSDHRQYPVPFLPAQTDGVRTGAVTDTGSKYTAAGHAATTHDMASRLSGAA
jgi:hypothetical protein